MNYHQLYKHLFQDIKGCALVDSFDAQAGESPHVQTRAHYYFMSRRANAENTVAARSTSREPGVLESMYPVTNHERESTGNTAEDQGTGESIGDEVELWEIQRDDGPTFRKRQKARGELMDVNTVNLDGLHVDEFQQMLVSSSVFGPCEGYVFRSAIKKLRTMKMVRIAAPFPWCADTGSLKGTFQRLNQQARSTTPSRILTSWNFCKKENPFIGTSSFVILSPLPPHAWTQLRK